MAGVARDECNTMPDGGTAYHQVEVIDGASGATQASFLGGVVLESVRNGQNMAFKGGTQPIQRQSVGGLLGWGTVGHAI